MLRKKAVDNKECCSFKHPKKCAKYCKFGIDLNYGCLNPECKYLHPILCRYSVRYNYCENEKCTYTHLKGTKRKRHSKTYTINQGHRQQRELNSRRSYSKFDPTKLGFQGYSAQKRVSRGTNRKKHYPNDLHTYADNPDDFDYQENDFPPFNPVPHSQATNHEKSAFSNPSNVPKFPEGQDFLDLLQAVKSVQESQINFQNKFQADLQSLKNLMLPQMPQQQHPQQHLLFSQPPNIQHQTQFFHAHSQPITQTQ